MKADTLIKLLTIITRPSLKKALLTPLLFIGVKAYSWAPLLVDRKSNSEIEILLLIIIVILSVVIFYKNRRIQDERSRAYNSDQRFKKLYDAGLVGLLFTNLDGNIVHANKTFLDIIGYTEQDLKAGEVNWNRLTAPEYRKITLDSLEMLKQQGFCAAFEKEYIGKDGRRVNVILGSSLLAPGDVSEAVTYVIDISYKKQAEKREQELNNIIKRQRENLYSILMNAPALIVIHRGPELTLEFVNKAANDFFNYSLTQGLAVKEVVAALKITNGISILEDVYRTGKPYEEKAFHMQIDRSDTGKPEDIWLNMVLEPVYDNAGNIDGVAFFGFDVTELVKANEEVQENERKFRFLADAISHKLWTSGPDGNATYYNKGWYDYTGVTNNGELGKRIWEIVHPDDLENAKILWNKTVETGENLEMEQRFMNKDGEYLWHLTRVHPHKDEEGNVIMWIGTSTNIQEQKRALEALKISEEHFKALANNSSIIIWQVNELGRLIFINDTWTKFTGLDLNENLLEQTLTSMHPDDLKETTTKLGAQFMQQIPMQAKFRLRKVNGAHRWVLVYANPIFNPLFAGYIGSMIDIDEQERAQKATRKLLKKKDEFLGIASHELKTPLTSMKASLQLLDKFSQSDVEPSRIRPFVVMANKQVKKLTDIVDDLLDVTKIQSGKMQLNVHSYAFHESVQECINDIQQYTRSHQLMINKNDEAVVVADRTRIEQVVVNFISNAIKYSPNKDRLIIDIEKLENEVKFSVTDFGIGIPQDKQAFIFDRFFRVHESSQSFSGLGLGLYISSEIISRHNGQIGMHSEEGAGSTFWFTLPLDHAG